MSECLRMPAGSGVPCVMGSVLTGSALVKYVDQCSRCGYIDPASLDRWAEEGYKSRMDDSAKRVSLAATGEPFTFVQGSDAPLTLFEGIGQALGAASMCWDPEPSSAVFRDDRAKQIYQQLIMLLREFMRSGEDKAVAAARARAEEYLNVLDPEQHHSVLIGREAILLTISNGA